MTEAAKALPVSCVNDGLASAAPGAMVNAAQATRRAATVVPGRAEENRHWYQESKNSRI